MIGVDDYLCLVDRALDGMAGIVTDLGDGLANTRPGIPGANSPYALLFHCVAMMGWWGGHVVAGATIDRDRDSELTARGSVADLVARIPAARAALAAVATSVAPGAAVRGRVADRYVGTPIGTRSGAALLHVYEELARHHGQMEVIADALRRGAGAGPAPSTTAPRRRDPEV